MKQTALYDQHVGLGGRVVDFSGWSLPVLYKSIIAEHHAVRNEAGIFDCSHMGAFLITGRDAYNFINFVISNDLDRISAGRCLYSPILYDNGTFVDDTIVSMYSVYKFFIIANASNADKVYDWLTSVADKYKFKVNIDNRLQDHSLLAVQGKNVKSYLDQIFPYLFEHLKPFSFQEIPFAGSIMIVSATGYTGEPGVEISIHNDVAPLFMEKFLSIGVTPCGLGARDSLRLEKGYSLYGHEIDDNVNALEAGLGWTVKFDKNGFIGKEALLKIKEEGPRRKLTGFIMTERGIPRSSYTIHDMDGDEIGFVTSGTYSPTLDKNIGLGYIPVNYSAKDVKIRIREKMLTARLSSRTFVK